MKTLEKALDCEDEKVILEGFMKRYDVSYPEAQDIFNETKKWLWLASKSAEDQNFSLFIDQPLTIIDEMWHTFILYTRAYYKYCFNKFNRLIHHDPASESENQLTNNIDPKTLLETQYNLIYDYLGRETLIKWYDTLPSKYTLEYIKSIKKA
ncbi:hypothetical protein [Fulvivirga ligni]|uniref:hypothetical protein n=1 Tax=Fulvivirga ligni TaxID=2904246 RepID=UPI001F2B8208|nr:hypothetical protein [Fulvivirga ligni]UII20628.1 hypothetical protein LVD16_22560 [Fulvivirga ligni]